MQLQQKLVLLRQRKKDAAERPDSFAAPSGKQEYIFYLYIRVSACARMDFFAAPPGVLKKKVSLYPPGHPLAPLSTSLLLNPDRPSLTHTRYLL